LGLQEPTLMYNARAPDGSCGIQVALLYCLLPPLAQTFIQEVL